MYKCECASEGVGGACHHVGGAIRTGHASKPAAQGSCSCSCRNLKWRQAGKGRWTSHEGGVLWPMTRRGGGSRQQQNKQMEPGRPLPMPTISTYISSSSPKMPILGPVGHELLGFQTCQSWPPAPLPASILSRPSSMLQQPCAAGRAGPGHNHAWLTWGRSS
jgi:hypothetical protein